MNDITNQFTLHDTLKIRLESLHLFSQGLGYTFINGGYETTFHPKFKRISTQSMIALHDATATSYDGKEFVFLDKNLQPIKTFSFDAYFGVRATMSKVVEKCKFSVKRGVVDIEQDSVNPNVNLIRWVSPATKAKFGWRGA